MIVDKEAPIYPIRTVAQLTGVNPRRIRAWEEQYHLITPARTGGGHRLFSEEDVDRIRWIKAMVDRGMSLKGIQRLVEAPPVPMVAEGRGGRR
jgi:DNA-binding transcriptional MerR regulator